MGRYLSFSDIFSDTVPEKDKGETVIAHMKTCSDFGSSADRILFMVGIANIVDLHVIGSGSALRGAVIAFYLSNEGLSLLENAAYIGLPIPDKLKAVLEQLHDRDKKEGKDNTTDQGDGE